MRRMAGGQSGSNTIRKTPASALLRCRRFIKIPSVMSGNRSLKRRELYFGCKWRGVMYDVWNAIFRPFVRDDGNMVKFRRKEDHVSPGCHS
ncbi:hypothetical protein [Sporosarcina globispora]|uniref:hypothetical protein n=1 Tax=Sporosarcina globispora TaxID=1459 RepID=UPI003BF5567F